MPPQQRPPAQFSLYAALQLPKTASLSDIKKAFRSLAWTHHPDKGGSSERFKEISFAYEVLSNPERRKEYDVKGDRLFYTGPPSSPEELAEMLLRGTGGKPSVRKSKDKFVAIRLSLEQFCSGHTHSLVVKRKVVDTSEAVRSCHACGGSGTSSSQMLLPFGPMCKPCGGSGKLWKICYVQEEITVFVEKGAGHGQTVSFAGKADEQPGFEAGDLIVVFHELQHSTFRRRGADLFMQVDISLAEALTGFKRSVRHLDGRRLLVKGNPIQELEGPVCVKAVKGQGMPLKGRPFLCGNLFLELNVCFPRKLDAAAASLLDVLLPPAAPVQGKGDGQVYSFENLDPSSPD